MRIIVTGALAAVVFCLTTATPAAAAEFTVATDQVLVFRATFTGEDTNPAGDGGQDFDSAQFDYWTVLVNLRGDGIDEDGNAYGFHEIQLRRSGSALEDPTAPVVKTFGFFSGLQPGVTMTETTVAAQPHGAGSQLLSTTINIVYDAGAGVVRFSGTIAGDPDLDGDGFPDTPKTDAVVDNLKGLKEVGIITGKEMGQIIKLTHQPIKK